MQLPPPKRFLCRSLIRTDIPQHIHPKHLHERVVTDIRKSDIRAHYPCVGKKYVQSSVPRYGVLDQSLHVVFVGCVNFLPTDLRRGGGRRERAQFVSNCRKVRGYSVADVERTNAILNVLVRGGAADAEGGVGAFEMFIIRLLVRLLSFDS